MTTTPSRHGFTLLEVLVVVSITILLMGMLMPMLTMARRSSRRSASLAVMAKVESALHQYKIDFKAYPYQLNSGDGVTPPINSLAYQIGTDISDADRQNVQADMVTAAAQYAYDLTNGEQRASVHTFVMNRGDNTLAHDTDNDPEGDEAPTGSTFNTYDHTWYFTYDFRQTTCVLLNRLGAERASLLMLTGDVTAHGVVMQEVDGAAGSNLVHDGRDLSQVPLVAAPRSLQRPGWAKDYLQGELEPRYLHGDAIFDAFGHPLIYINQVQPGVEPTVGEIWGRQAAIPYPSIYGLAPIGRRTLQHLVPGTSTPITGDPVTLPDITHLMHSDIRAWAAPGLELEFELWSAGEDGVFGWFRDDPANRDNIPCEPYNRDIDP